MATASSVKRAVDQSGDDVLTYEIDGKQAQAVALVDDLGQMTGILANKLQVEDAAVSVEEYNITLATANKEYSLELPAGCRKLVFRCRDDTVAIRYSWTQGTVATPTSPYQTLRPGAEYATDFVRLGARTLYFASSTAGVVIEAEVWT